MAKNKIFQWMDQVKGLVQMIPKDMSFTDTAKMMIHCFWKTRSDIQKPALTNIKNPLEDVKEDDASKVAEIKADAKKAWYNAIRDLQLPEFTSKKPNGESKFGWPFDGFLPGSFRKMGKWEKD